MPSVSTEGRDLSRTRRARTRTRNAYACHPPLLPILLPPVPPSACSLLPPPPPRPRATDYHQQTWNALVAGRKRWMLYPPNASFYSELHPLEWVRRGRHLGTDDLPPPLECEQRAGDVLFVPRLWGHGTINLGETVGVAMPFSMRAQVDYGGALQSPNVSSQRNE